MLSFGYLQHLISSTLDTHLVNTSWCNRNSGRTETDGTFSGNPAEAEAIALAAQMSRWNVSLLNIWTKYIWYDTPYSTSNNSPSTNNNILDIRGKFGLPE